MVASTDAATRNSMRSAYFFLADVFFDVDFLVDAFLDEDFFAGTFAPALRASDSPMAIACLRLVTFLPDLPLFKVPCLRSRMTFLTLDCAFLPYLGIVLSLRVFSKPRPDDTFRATSPLIVPSWRGATGAYDVFRRTIAHRANSREIATRTSITRAPPL